MVQDGKGDHVYIRLEIWDSKKPSGIYTNYQYEYIPSINMNLNSSHTAKKLVIPGTTVSLIVYLPIILKNWASSFEEFRDPIFIQDGNGE